MSERRPRMRAMLSDQFTTVVVGLLLVALVGGWLSYGTYVASEPRVEEQTVTVWETTGEFNHGAVVETNSSVFPAGTRLSDRPIYFTRLSPRLTGTFRSSYGETPHGNLTRTISVSLLIRSIDGTTDEEVVYWQAERRLSETTVAGVSPEEPVGVGFTYNVTAVENRIERIRDQLGATAGEIEVLVEATVRSRGQVGNRQVDETNNYTMPVEVSDATYSVGDTGPTTESYEATRTETVEPSDGPVRRFGGPVVALVALCGVTGLVVGRRRGWLDLTTAERERLAYRGERAEFDDWISTVELPEAAFDLPRAEADSLTALVDVAIDTNNSVVEDPEAERFYLRHDGYLYSYQPPEADSEDEQLQDSDERIEDSERIDDEHAQTNDDGNSSGNNRTAAQQDNDTEIQGR